VRGVSWPPGALGSARENSCRSGRLGNSAKRCGERTRQCTSVLHVLLVEDNPSDVLLIREAIRTSDVPADVTIAYDGDTALRMLEHSNSTLDLIILDLNLPRVGGLEILRRHPPNGESPPVVVFTSSNDPEERKRAMGLGASDYIVKPMTWDAYLDAIRGAVDTARSIRFR
jgi:CheY-like chemotaxis protein